MPTLVYISIWFTFAFDLRNEMIIKIVHFINRKMIKINVNTQNITSVPTTIIPQNALQERLWQKL